MGVHWLGRADYYDILAKSMWFGVWVPFCKCTPITG